MEPPPGMQGSNTERIDTNGPMNLSLPLGQLANEKRDKSIYDDKMVTQAEYRFDGIKEGAKWKSKVERYFITKVPVAMEILKWAEAHNLEKINESKFIIASQPHLNEEQCQTFSREIWGFLSGCLSGQAEVHFKRADMLNGLDAWRRVVRIIEDTLPMRFEQLRRAAQMVHMKVIKDLDGTPNGIAEFENTLEEYEAVGGARADDQTRKADLLSILPNKVQSDLLWKSTVPTETYEQFRDEVLLKSARMVDLERRQGQRRGGVNAVAKQDDGPPPLGTSAQEDQDEDDREAGNPISSLEELLAMVNRSRTNADQRRPQRQRQPQRGDGDRQRGPRKCANCGKEHEQRTCPHPSVPVSDRPCWTCGKKGHASRDCPDKKDRKGAVKAIEDILPFFGQTLNAVTNQDDGFTKARKTVRPTPRAAQLGDFIPTTTRNRFNTIKQDEAPQRSQPPSRTNPMHGSQPAKSAIYIRSKPATTIRAEGKKEKPKVQSACPGSVAPVQPTQQLAPAQSAPSLQPSANQAEKDANEKQQTELFNLENAVMKAVKEYQNYNTVSLVEEEMKVLGGRGGTPDTRYPTSAGCCNLIFDDEDVEEPEQVAVVACEKVRVGVAADSGATDNVIGLDDLPAGVVPEGPIGPPFSNASGGDIQKFGKVATLMENEDGKVGCAWTACAVTRPLHSVSKVCGPEEGPGVQDFMFNNRIGVVMPPGLVNLILKYVKPVARYPRRGGLYVGDFEMSSFPRQGPAR